MADPIRDLLAERALRTVGTEEAKRQGLVPPDQLPTPAELAMAQVAEAVAAGRMDLTGTPRWGWPELDELVGPMLPGDFVVVGAETGNGKSSFLMSAMEHWATARMGTLYIPLEVDPLQCRRRWAAWSLGLDVVKVMRNQWDALPPGSQEAHECAMEEQALSPYIHFAPPKRASVADVVRWSQWAAKHYRVRVVVVDHFHRMTHLGNGVGNYRLAVGDSAMGLKNLARELGVVVVASCQLNRSNDVLSAYFPPTLTRLREASTLADEADHVMVLSRRLRPGTTVKELKAARASTTEEWRVADPGIMVVTCRKHRLDDARARDHRACLRVQGGRVISLDEEQEDRP